ncbi:hypothetical protein N0V95_005749 [Ascochyta clinopodiicola]|nr:hypothetical protein N0V95_005749 [Ascochyta clinopodiicola]
MAREALDEDSGVRRSSFSESMSIVPANLHLELSLASAEAERDKLQGELVAAREEAERWKEQYERLRRAVRDTVERQF